MIPIELTAKTPDASPPEVSWIMGKQNTITKKNYVKELHSASWGDRKDFHILDPNVGIHVKREEEDEEDGGVQNGREIDRFGGICFIWGFLEEAKS